MEVSVFKAVSNGGCLFSRLLTMEGVCFMAVNKVASLA